MYYKAENVQKPKYRGYSSLPALLKLSELRLSTASTSSQFRFKTCNYTLRLRLLNGCVPSIPLSFLAMSQRYIPSPRPYCRCLNRYLPRLKLESGFKIWIRKNYTDPWIRIQIHRRGGPDYLEITVLYNIQKCWFSKIFANQWRVCWCVRKQFYCRSSLKYQKTRLRSLGMVNNEKLRIILVL